MWTNVGPMMHISVEGLFIRIIHRRLSKWSIVLREASHNRIVNWAALPSGHHLHLIIKIHISNNVSVMGQRRERVAQH